MYYYFCICLFFYEIFYNYFNKFFTTLSLRYISNDIINIFIINYYFYLFFMSIEDDDCAYIYLGKLFLLIVDTFLFIDYWYLFILCT